MSNTDSFVDEVNEELRRDKLFATLRRWGPVALLAVVGLVGYTAYSEWRAADQRAQAQAAGDALYAALEDADVPAAIAALDHQGPVEALAHAAALTQAGDRDGARAALEALAAAPDTDAIYTDLAALKAQMLGAPDMAVLEQLSLPGRPYRLPALEQTAIARLAAGDADGAIAAAQAVIEDAGVTRGQAERMMTLMLALGVDPQGSQGVDPQASQGVDPQASQGTDPQAEEGGE